MEEVAGSADGDSNPEEEETSPETIPLISTKEPGPVAVASDCVLAMASRRVAEVKLDLPFK